MHLTLVLALVLPPRLATPVQDVLSKAVGGSAMTIAEATNIADSALEHTVRTILASLQAPEILKSTAGKPSVPFSPDHPVTADSHSRPVIGAAAPHR